MARGDPASESSNVNVLVRRASQLAGRSMSTNLSSERTLQPRNDQCDRRTCYRKVKANTEEEATVMCTLRGHRGMGGGTRAQSSGVNWGTSGFPPQADNLGCSSLRRESISGGEESRGADEAVVSDDPPGQQNPMASQGPLDGRVGVAGSRATLNRKVLQRGNPFGDRVLLGARTAVAYKTESWGECGRHLSPGKSSKVAIDGPFEAVLGKTRRTEF